MTSSGNLEVRLRASIERTVKAAEVVDAAVAEEIRLVEATFQAMTKVSVVVVGEVKQGKSSLVNALTGRPGLSPVDVDVATATYLVIGHSDKEGVVVNRHGDVPFDIRFDEISRWATPATREAVRYIDVAVRAPWLEGIYLFDTPGAGGLHASHADTALAASAQATALLFVTDASAPLSDVELEFLGRAGVAVDTVVFVLTKIGRYHGWTDVLAENQANLANVAPRFKAATWMAVDSNLGAAALATLGRPPGPADDASLIEDWNDSGVGDLLALLQGLAPRASLLAATNLARMCRSTVDRLDRLVTEREGALTLDPGLTGALEAEQARLKALQVEQRSWGSVLDKEVNRVRFDMSRSLTEQTGEIRIAWNARLRGLRRAPDDAGVTELLAELSGEVDALADNLLARMRAQFRQILDVLFDEELVDRDNVPAALDALSRKVQLSAPVALPPGKAFGAQDTMDSYYGWMMGQGLAAVALAPLLGALAGPALVVGGIAGIGARVWAKKDSLRASDLNQTVVSWVTEAQSLIRAEIERNAGEAKSLIADAFRTTLDVRREELDAALAERNRAKRAGEVELDGARKAIGNSRNAVKMARQGLDAALADNELKALAAPPLTAPIPVVRRR